MDDNKGRMCKGNSFIYPAPNVGQVDKKTI